MIATRRLPGRADDAPRLGGGGRAGARRARALDRASTWTSSGRAADLVDEHIGDEPVAPLAPRIAVRAAQQKLPVGLVAALDQQLRAQAAGDRLDEVLDEVDKVRDEVGSPPLAAPIGQIVASQALLNVLTANRYSTMVDELRDLVDGRFGRTPGPIDPALRRAVELRTRRAHGASRAGRPRRAPRGGGRARRRARRSCCCSRSSARRPSRCCARSASASGGDESLAASGVDQARAERIREVVRIVQETGVGEITIEEDGMRVSVRRTAEQAYVAGRRRAAPRRRRPEPAAGRAARRRARARREPDGRHLLPRARAGRRAVRRGGRRVAAGPDALHPRGDEADERGEGGDRGRSCARSTSATPSPSSTASCSSSSSRSTAAADASDVQPGPRREPGRDRRPGDPRAARARRRGRRRSTRPPTADALHVRMADHAVLRRAAVGEPRATCASRA